MRSGSGEAGTAAVLPISAARSRRAAAVLLAKECPGWEAAYQVQQRQWIGRRRGGMFLCTGTTDPRYLVVTAADHVGLYVQINLCSIGIILNDYQDWQLACDHEERSWSAALPADGDHDSHTVCDLTPAQVLHGIRLHLAGIGQDGEVPWLGEWDDPGV